MSGPGAPDPHARSLRRYVAWQAGLLDEEQVAEDLAHLDSCESCREAAASMRQSAEGSAGHLAPDLLARWPRYSARLHGLERELVQNHLQRCEYCRKDLSMLGHSLELSAEEAVPSQAAAPAALTMPRVIRLESRRVSLREWMLAAWGALATAACIAILATQGVVNAPIAPVPVVTQPERPGGSQTSAPEDRGRGSAARPGTGPGGATSPAAVAPVALLAVSIDLASAGERGAEHWGESPPEFRTVAGPAGIQLIHPGGLAIGVPAGSRVRVTVVPPSGERLTFERTAAELEGHPDFVLLPKHRVEPGEYTVRYEFVDRSLERNNAEVRFRLSSATK